MKVKIILGLCVLAALVAPKVLPLYYVTLLIPFFAYAIILLGFNLLFGYGGQLSFGHALFVAFGAYAAAAVNSRYGVESFELMLVVAVVAAFVLSIPIALIASRFTGIFFGMLTLSFGMLFYTILFKFYNITGGESGISIPRPYLLGHSFKGLDQTAFLCGPFYYYCLILALVLGWIMWRLVHSSYGLHLMAARDNASKAIFLGVKVRWVRTIAFIISAIYGAVGGVILGVNVGLADPELSYWTHSAHLVFMTILGGYQEFFGPALGTLVFIFAQDRLMSETEYWRFFVGLALAIVVIVAPGGILGSLQKVGLKRKA
ncbi:MAG: branched-chain amino acid ABC transporter permease [Candidimonas sp.]|nr:MAG: branched-chain amino acid ABC transporter permease [Candidimonas sp.]TAM26755.1 MAG: branched-chain amino acid ABC transporter permease [Candidimonas sp.]TAM74430.1 MAG: branched-chain amino acid ABC transporter permease [Candidimonas sp.]